MKQKTLRVFEVEDLNRLKKVVESKYELVCNYFFMLKNENKDIEDYLRSKNLSYFVLNSNKSFSKLETKTEIIERIIEKKVIKNFCKTYFFDRIIRSGEEIILNGNAIFFKRINSGAKIEIEGNLILLDENEGLIKVDGDFALIKKNVGIIFFNSEEINKIDKLTFFYKDKRLEI